MKIHKNERPATANSAPALVIAILTLTLAALTACVKDDLYNTPHPNQGAILLATDWTRRGQDVPIPATYTVEAAGSTFVMQAREAAIPALFAPGTITLLAYNQPDGVSIAGGTATVARDAASALQRPDPGTLFGGTANAGIMADDTVHVPLPMRQLFRRVQFERTVSGGDAERITGIEARLEGMASSVSIATGEVTGGDVAVRIPFVRTAGKLTAEIQVPGTIADIPQRTVVTLTFTDGKRLTTDTDVSEAFAGFNTDKLTPLRLTGSLYAPVGSETDGAIIRWEDVQGGDVDADM